MDRRLTNLRLDAIDLLRRHRPSPDVCNVGEMYGVFDDLVGKGEIRYYDVSAECVTVPLKAI